MLTRIQPLLLVTASAPQPHPLSFLSVLAKSMSHSSAPSVPPAVKETGPTAQSSTVAKPMLTLPAPGDVAQDGNQLEVNGKDVKLDALGPVVVNEDGTISRINNWAEMADIEKDNVRRILLKRNEQRLKKLRENKSESTDAGSN